MSVTVALGGNIKSISPAIETAIQVAKKFGTSLNGFCAMPDPAAASIYVTGAETVMLGTSAIASITSASAWRSRCRHNNLPPAIWAGQT
ncbi:MAG: hypothetical protein AAFQ15_03205 [Pseudomonadota bacterium]